MRSALLLLFALSCADPIAERDVAIDPFMTMTETSSTATSTTTDDECVLPGRRISRQLYQIGSCVWAAGVIANGYGAETACCADGTGTSTVTGPNSDNCTSARTWIERSNDYYYDRCWRRMSCGEITGLVLWFSSKERLFTNLTRWCTEATGTSTTP